MSNDTPIQHGKVTATYFWDDGSGINGDTGQPAGGEPMQKGLFSSPSWPLGTEGYIEYEGQTAEFFIGDRGPGDPSQDCDVLLDMDGQTFADITGESWDSENLVVSGGNGHLYDVEYYITKWGDGAGEEGAPHPFNEPGNKCEDAVSPLPEEKSEDSGDEKSDESKDEKSEKSEDSQDEKSEKSQDSQDEQSEEEEQSASGSGDDGGDDSGVTAETAANDVSGFQLTGADGGLGGGGLLFLAIIPAILLALAFAWFRRPAGVHAGEADTEGKGFFSLSEGKHALISLRDRILGRNED